MSCFVFLSKYVLGHLKGRMGDQPSEGGTRLASCVKPKGLTVSLGWWQELPGLSPCLLSLSFWPIIPQSHTAPGVTLPRCRSYQVALLHKLAANPTSPAGEGPHVMVWHSNGPSVPSNLTSPWPPLSFCSKHITILLRGLWLFTLALPRMHLLSFSQW